MTTRHTFATQSPTKGRLVCQCPECQGKVPVKLCKHTAEMFPVEEVTTEGPKEQADLFTSKE